MDHGLGPELVELGEAILSGAFPASVPGQDGSCDGPNGRADDPARPNAALILPPSLDLAESWQSGSFGSIWCPSMRRTRHDPEHALWQSVPRPAPPARGDGPPHPKCNDAPGLPGHQRLRP